MDTLAQVKLRADHAMYIHYPKPSAQSVRGFAPGPAGVPLDPVARDVDAPADPHVAVGLDMVEETLERRETPGPADEARV